MKPDQHTLKAITLLEKLLEHGSFYSSAIELSGRIDGEELGDEVEVIVEAFRKEYPLVEEP